jgi:hypothetical protein
VAVGYYENSSKHDATLAETWNGTDWTVASTPNVSGKANSLLASVSCSSSTSCVAVGTAYSGQSPFVTLAAAWNGTTWTLQSTPNPGASLATRLFSVSCPSPSFCSAVGIYYANSTTIATIAESWNGTDWSIVATPNSSPTFGELESVSCTGPDVCTAVGAGAGGLVESWDGTSWSIEHSFTKDNNLWAVSCASTSECLALSPIAATSSKPTAALWNGSAWTSRALHQPSPSTVSQVTGLSCLSSTFCMVAGSTSAAKTLAEVWTGSGWKVTQTKF